jgi:hypothetical protein
LQIELSVCGCSDPDTQSEEKKTMTTKETLAFELAQDERIRESIRADARLAELEPVEPVPELTVLQKFQASVLVCRDMADAIKISPAILAEVLELKVPIPHYFFGSVRAICAEGGWTARMTWSELALEIGQAARRSRREELLAGEIMRVSAD